MFWEFYQSRQIARANRKANSAKSAAERTHLHINRLEGKIESLALACQSLWELLQEHTALTEADLEQKMEEIDMRDGQRDGRLSKRAEACEKCGRKTSRRRPNCLYCGHFHEADELFGRQGAPRTE